MTQISFSEIFTENYKQANEGTDLAFYLDILTALHLIYLTKKIEFGVKSGERYEWETGTCNSEAVETIQNTEYRVSEQHFHIRQHHNKPLTSAISLSVINLFRRKGTLK